MEFLKELKKSVLTLNNEETESVLTRGATVKEGRIQVCCPRTVFCLLFFSIKRTSMTAS